MLSLYVAPGTCALASHLALEWAGAEYEAIHVDFAGGQQRSAAYLQLNPKGRVPTLRCEHGVLTETPAILLYIAQRYPAAALTPLDDAFALAQMNAFMSYLCSTVHVAHAHRMRGARWVDAAEADALAAMQRKVASNMAECFTLIDTQLLRGPWVLGERFSVADPYLFTLARWLEGDGVDPQRFPKVLQHRQRLAEHPVVLKVLAAQQAAAARP